jgi:hypothetical protein
MYPAPHPSAPVQVFGWQLPPPQVKRSAQPASQVQVFGWHFPLPQVSPSQQPASLTRARAVRIQLLLWIETREPPIRFGDRGQR